MTLHESVSGEHQEHDKADDEIDPHGALPVVAAVVAPRQSILIRMRHNRARNGLVVGGGFWVSLRIGAPSQLETAMGEVINLRSYRKKKQRAERERDAAGNRARGGRSKAERKRDRHIGKATVEFLDDRRLDDRGDQGDQEGQGDQGDQGDEEAS